MIAKKIKIIYSFLDYWKMHLWKSPTLGMIWSLVPQAEQPPKICPPSAMKSFIKSSLHVFGGRNYALAPLENYVGVYAPSYLQWNAD